MNLIPCIHKYLAALPDEVKQIITEAFTLIAARTYTTRAGRKEMDQKMYDYFQPY